MKAKELIAALSLLDPELPVYTEDTEWGSCPVTHTKTVQEGDGWDLDHAHIIIKSE